MMTSASNPVPILGPPPDTASATGSSSFLDRIGSEFDEEDVDELESYEITSHPTSPEKLDIVSTSSFVFDYCPDSLTSCRFPNLQDVASSTVSVRKNLVHCSRESDEEEERGAKLYLPSGSAVGGTTIVEEQIETIITTEGMPGLDVALSPGDASVSSHSSSISHVRNPLLYADQENETLDVELNLDNPAARVPFPELGLDLVDINFSFLYTEENNVKKNSSSEIRLTELKSWEENWLFKQRKKKPNSVSSYFAFADLDFASEPVRMFIPNPSQQAITLIGQEDVQESYDLSERNSVASLSFSSDSESEWETVDNPSDNKSASSSLHHSPQTMTQGLKGLLAQENDNLSQLSHRVVVVDADPKQQQPAAKTAHHVEEGDKDQSCLTSCPNDLRRAEGKSLQIPDSTSFLKTTSPELPISNHTGRIIKSQNNREKIATAEPSCLAQKAKVKFFQNHDSSSPLSSCGGENISLPPFVPLSKRMESCRSDPCFVIKPCGASVQTAITVQFCCRVKGSRPLGVAWFKGDHLLIDDDTFRIFSSGNEFVLEIKATQLHHSDVYSCVVYNGFGEQWSDFNLSVKERARSPQIPKQPTQTTESKDEDQASLNRGIDVNAFRAGKSPKIITLTWAERTAVGRDAKEAKVTNGRNEKESRCSPNRPSGSPVGEETEIKFPISEKENNDKWNQSAVSDWPQNPYSGENLRKRIVPPAQRPVIYSSLKRNASPGHESATGVGRDNNNGHQRQESAASHVNDKEDVNIISLTSKYKDLSTYRRDYFVPSAKDETLNGLDEKVYESAKFFSLRVKAEKEDCGSSTDENPSMLTTYESPSVSGSLAESTLSQKDSGQGDDRDSNAVDDDEETDDAEEKETRRGMSPSVRKLVRRFSRKENNPRIRNFTSCGDIYEECNGKGLRPKIYSPDSSEVCAINPHSLRQHFEQKHNIRGRPLNRLGSLSMFDIDQFTRPQCGSAATIMTASSTNEGYNSDDSALSANTKLQNQRNECQKILCSESVELIPTKKVSRTIMKRASFWQQRCDKGLLSDNSVAEEYPGIDSIYD